MKLKNVANTLFIYLLGTYFLKILKSRLRIFPKFVQIFFKNFKTEQPFDESCKIQLKTKISKIVEIRKIKSALTWNNHAVANVLISELLKNWCRIVKGKLSTMAAFLSNLLPFNEILEWLTWVLIELFAVLSGVLYTSLVLIQLYDAWTNNNSLLLFKMSNL